MNYSRKIGDRIQGIIISSNGLCYAAQDSWSCETSTLLLSLILGDKGWPICCYRALVCSTIRRGPGYVSYCVTI